MSNFPYAHVINQVHQRKKTALLAVLNRKPKLAPDVLPSNSSIVLATSAMHECLIELHRDPGGLHTIERRRFEEIIAELFGSFGYSVELTSQTRDGGRDVIAIGNNVDVKMKFLIECKRPDPGNSVGVGVVRQLLGVVEDEKATKGILVATTYFSPDAKALEERNQWRLELKEFDAVTSWIDRYVRIKNG